jgi:hypothetical protein
LFSIHESSRNSFISTRMQHLLELIRVPKRRNVVGLDCEPWTVSSDSLFTIKPIDITAKFFIVAGLSINNIYPSAINSDSGYLRSVLRVIVHHKDKGKTYVSRISDQKEVTRCLSTGQLFLGVHGFTRRDVLLRSKWEGVCSLSSETAPKVSQI